VLVTGANGFIGRNLCVFLKKKGYFVRGTVRKSVYDISGVDEHIQVGDIDQKTDWQQALAGIDVAVHLAARVHIINEKAASSIEEFRKVNVVGTERLAQVAVKAGVKRFIFVSSVKVNGEGVASAVGRVLDSSASPQNDRGVYREEDVPKPEDAYGISKLEAEQAVIRIADETGLEVVVLRLPLVYGPGVKANFINLVKIAGSGLPLPFKRINNKRSFLYIGNLMEAIAACIGHPRAAGQTFLLSDGQDLSTPDLIKMIAKAMGKRVMLFSLPLRFLRMMCRIMGKAKEFEKLTGSLRVDNSKIRNLLGWNPPFTMEEGIKETLK
jgi:nucleoside-diphosphate-sugar epimerase